VKAVREIISNPDHRKKWDKSNPLSITVSSRINSLELDVYGRAFERVNDEIVFNYVALKGAISFGFQVSSWNDLT
jgi:hypothetical protein